MQTGDLVLCARKRGLHVFSSAVDWATGSQYSHVGMILVDPTFIHSYLRGTYVWQSTSTKVPNAESPHTHVFGVQLTPFSECVRANPDYTFYVRRLERGADVFNPKVLRRIHTTVHERPYDVCPKHWCAAALHRGGDAGAPDSFWCSALVAYVLVELGVLPRKTNWRLVRPVDLSTEAPIKLPLGLGVVYGREEKAKP